MLMGVNPGIVFISLIQTLPELRSRKKSTRARPEPSIAVERPQRQIANLLRFRILYARRNFSPAFRISILCIIIVKFMGGKYFAYHGSLRRIVSENRAFHLAPVDSLFDQNLAVKLSGMPHGLSNSLSS